jgi:hypothetical protein
MYTYSVFRFDWICTINGISMQKVFVYGVLPYLLWRAVISMFCNVEARYHQRTRHSLKSFHQTDSLKDISDNLGLC